MIITRQLCLQISIFLPRKGQMVSHSCVSYTRKHTHCSVILKSWRTLITRKLQLAESRDPIAIAGLNRKRRRLQRPESAEQLVDRRAYQEAEDDPPVHPAARQPQRRQGTQRRRRRRIGRAQVPRVRLVLRLLREVLRASHGLDVRQEGRPYQVNGKNLIFALVFKPSIFTKRFILE